MTITTTKPTTVLCPRPLLIHKQPRRATFRARILSKSFHRQISDQYALGPLDDIIDEIKREIWGLLPDPSVDSSVFHWAEQFQEPSTWTVAPLPLSRIPTDHPLTIRKNRTSRSSASSTSMAGRQGNSRHGSQEETASGGPVGPCYTTETTAWPLMDLETSYEAAPLPSSSTSTDSIRRPTAQEALENVSQDDKGNRPAGTQRRPSRLRLLTNGFPRLLRRMGTDEGSGAASGTTSPETTALLAASDDQATESDTKNPSDEVVEAYARRHARKYVLQPLIRLARLPMQIHGPVASHPRLTRRSGIELASLMGRLSKSLPGPTERDLEPQVAPASGEASKVPPTLRAAVRIFAEKKMLTEEVQEFDVAVEIEGVLHNRRLLPDPTIDVIFVVDNGYYVTKACLEKALDAVRAALYHLSRGDRVALYTTHCTHHAVTGNRPDMHYPIRPISSDTEELFRELTARIAHHGTQVWDPPRPNPSMTDVILSVARSLEGQDLKTGRTHIILLSPAIYVLHDVSKFFPDPWIHRINAAVLPYRRRPELQDTICSEECCKKVFVSNWSVYQSIQGRIKRIIKFARSEFPVGTLTDLTVDIRSREGCEIIECYGKQDAPHLYLGQIHAYFARIRVIRARTRPVDLASTNPIFNSSLDVKNTRLELTNAVAMGASKVHLFDVQVFYRDSLNPADCWNYTETPLLVIRELGRLAWPLDVAMEVYKRQYFYRFHQPTTEAAKAEAENILRGLNINNEEARKLVARMRKELECHQKIQAYEDNFRQKLPMCPGPIEIENSTHESLVELWDHKKSKRNAVINDEDISVLTSGMAIL